jgi:hypothetical protein
MVQHPAAYLLRPIRSNGVYSALAMGFHNATDRKELLVSVPVLNNVLTRGGPFSRRPHI